MFPWWEARDSKLRYSWDGRRRRNGGSTLIFCRVFQYCHIQITSTRSRFKGQKGVIVMVFHQIEPIKGHVNGERYNVSDTAQNTSQRILTLRATAGNRLRFPQMPCGSSYESFPTQDVLKAQFRVCVCFGITASKAQRQPLSGVLEHDLHKHVIFSWTVLHCRIKSFAPKTPLHYLTNVSTDSKRGLHKASSKLDEV